MRQLESRPNSTYLTENIGFFADAETVFAIHCGADFFNAFNPILAEVVSFEIFFRKRVLAKTPWFGRAAELPISGRLAVGTL